MSCGWCLQVSQVALPVYVRRVRSILEQYRASPKADRHTLQDCLCCLETLAAMTLAPSVTDVVLQPHSRIKASLGCEMPVISVEWLPSRH